MWFDSRARANETGVISVPDKTWALLIALNSGSPQSGLKGTRDLAGFMGFWLNGP